MSDLLPLLLLGFLGLFVALYLSMMPRYRLWKAKTDRMNEIDAHYEALRKMRRELIYHVDWARERGDRQDAIRLEPEVEKVDKELEELKKQYEELEKEGKVPSKSL